LIALDEPVSALDVSIRSQVLDLLKDLQRERGLAYLLISHDMAAVEYLCHRVGVMCLGKRVEVGSAEREKGHIDKLYLCGRRGHAPEEVQLMCDVYQRSRLDLGMALGDPVCQADGI